MTAPAPGKAEPKKDSKPTDYIVLRQMPPDATTPGGPHRYEVFQNVTASGEKAAKRAAFADYAKSREGEIAAVFVAIPLRSWQPEPLRMVNQPRIVFGD